MQTTTVTHQQVFDLVGALPEERLQSVYDFALFLKQQPYTPENDLFGESADEIEADEAQWQQQFSASRDKLRSLAYEAAAEFREGNTQLMEFSAEGRLVR